MAGSESAAKTRPSEDGTKAVSRMIRSCVRTPALKSVSIEGSGFALLFKYPFGKYPYRNLLIREND
ncbi:hypothetical protein D7Z26_24655 [Cohnella endophytica]|uniref:Uncharacterized protein n=1 Tax=Cohnella endophytica TaxID=2419778 RepID=A0A494X6F0_9BACL|nr:hypothetical protein [Cohnella endophytica]RKP46275.1 hypothetical protein D7Z26_24655 [Cohnella endophytica]